LGAFPVSAPAILGAFSISIFKRPPDQPHAEPGFTGTS
jgi:hypothetical protein